MPNPSELLGVIPYRCMLFVVVFCARLSMVCVCVRARARARVCVCVRARVCLPIVMTKWDMLILLFWTLRICKTVLRYGAGWGGGGATHRGQ